MRSVWFDEIDEACVTAELTRVSIENERARALAAEGELSRNRALEAFTNQRNAQRVYDNRGRLGLQDFSIYQKRFGNRYPSYGVFDNTYMNPSKAIDGAWNKSAWTFPATKGVRAPLI